jgi:hypothetical protein
LWFIIELYSSLWFLGTSEASAELRLELTNHTMPSVQISIPFIWAVIRCMASLAENDLLTLHLFPSSVIRLPGRHSLQESPKFAIEESQERIA